MQGLDEVQSYVLLRRWLLRSSDEVVGGVLLPAQRAALAAEYALERLCLLKCLEGLLLHYYATAGGDGGAPGAWQARVLGVCLLMAPHAACLAWGDAPTERGYMESVCRSTAKCISCHAAAIPRRS